MEVLNVIDHRNTNIQDAETPAPVPVKSPGPSLEIQEMLPPNLTEHKEDSKRTVDHVVPSSPHMFSQLEPAQAFKNPSTNEADFATSTDKIEVQNISENGSTSKSAMLTAGIKSQEHKINHLENIAVTPNKKAEAETETEKRPKSPYRGLVDTAAPFESVKEAVTKFGGIVDWKAYKAQTLERRRATELELEKRRRATELELEKVQQEIPQFKEDVEAVEMAKSQVVEELERTNRLIEELKHKLERAQIEADQARQDSELAQLRAQEMDQGIDDEASVIAQTQLSVAKERHQKAIEELKLVKEGLSSTHEKYIVLVTERDIAIKRAEEVVSAAKETEKRVEELTLEFISSKESLELSHAAHHESEEHRLGAALAKEQDCLDWEKELQQAQDELRQLNEQILSKTDLESKLDESMHKLLSLNTELAAYMEHKLSEETGVVEQGSDEAKEISTSIKQALASTRKELDEVRGNIEKATNEANIIRASAELLRSELDKEKASLVTLQQREGMASITVSSLEAELNRTKEEIEMFHKKEEETREKMVGLPKMLQEAAQEADDAKVTAHSAHEELRKAKEAAEQSKAAAATAEIRLRAVLKEIEASKASERLALLAAQALQESEETRSAEDSPRGVTLPIAEYHALSKRVHEAEELANERMAAALAQIELAKESESKTIERFYEASKEMKQKKDALENVLERGQRAQEGKLGAEQELRKWRAEHEQRRKAHEAAKHAVDPLSSSPMAEHKGSYEEDEVFKESKLPVSSNSMDDFSVDQKLRKKKSFFPQMSTLLSKKAQTQT